MAKAYYVYSTLVGDNTYDQWGPSFGGLPQAREGIKIAGGYGVASKSLVTPRGAVTMVTEEQHARLVSDPLFKLHRDGGFLTVEETNAPAEVVAANMNQADPSRPFEEGDLQPDSDDTPAQIKRQRKGGARGNSCL